jgi:hypothetical protein
MFARVVNRLPDAQEQFSKAAVLVLALASRRRIERYHVSLSRCLRDDKLVGDVRNRTDYASDVIY